MRQRLFLLSWWIWAHWRLGRWPRFGQFFRICRAYSGKGRYYHTLAHLVSCMKVIKTHYLGMQHTERVVLALFFHDFVYDVHSEAGLNERLSAHEWCLYGSLSGFGAPVVEDVRDMILLTAAHKLPAGSPLHHQVMNDVDMSILAADDPTYLKYARDVWREYSVHGRDKYVTGRSKFLTTTDPWKVFYTQAMRNRAGFASGNLQKELHLLENYPEAILVSVD